MSFCALGAIGIVVYAFLTSIALDDFMFSAQFFVLAALSLVVALTYKKAKFNGAYYINYPMINAGVHAEDSVRNMLMGLPDGYNVISTAIVSHDGEKSEMDLIVVGPTGVFIVEVKNITGKIVGRESDTNWRQYKTFRKGGGVSNEFYSPVKQVRTHAYRLKSFLKGNRIDVWVQEMVYLWNPNIDASEVSGGKTPIFTDADGKKALLSYILGYAARKPLDAGTINTAASYITQESIRNI